MGGLYTDFFAPTGAPSSSFYSSSTSTPEYLETLAAAAPKTGQNVLVYKRGLFGIKKHNILTNFCTYFLKLKSPLYRVSPENI